MARFFYFFPFDSKGVNWRIFTWFAFFFFSSLSISFIRYLSSRDCLDSIKFLNRPRDTIFRSSLCEFLPVEGKSVRGEIVIGLMFPPPLFHFQNDSFSTLRCVISL